MASSILPRGLLGCLILDKPLTPKTMGRYYWRCTRDFGTLTGTSGLGM
jgi:hypothetical protein